SPYKRELRGWMRGADHWPDMAAKPMNSFHIWPVIERADENEARFGGRHGGEWPGMHAVGDSVNLAGAAESFAKLPLRVRHERDGVGVANETRFNRAQPAGFHTVDYSHRPSGLGCVVLPFLAVEIDEINDFSRPLKGGTLEHVRQPGGRKKDGIWR